MTLDEGFSTRNRASKLCFALVSTKSSRCFFWPRWGVRSTGKVGSTAYTVLVTDDRGGGLTIVPSPLGNDFAPQDFKSLSTIGRLRHDLSKAGSFVGAVVTDRENNGGGHNRVIGPDFQWRPNDTDSVTMELLHSDTRDGAGLLGGTNSTGHAFVAGWKPTLIGDCLRHAGASALPQDLREAADTYGLGGWTRWRTLYLPAVFPHLVTGLITAAGGAWNASIVAEYVRYGGRTLVAPGLGSLITQASEAANFSLLAAGVLTMSFALVLLNRTVWRRLYRVADERFSLNR